MKEVKLKSEAEKALQLLKNSGYEAYAVGGCVRDCLLGKESYDIDITTDAKPDEIKRVFEAFRVVETVIKHGTVTVLIEGLPVEITTYRTESGYKDNRHPSSVAFSSDLHEDLKRRDFTINALCFDGTAITDDFDGIGDLNKKIIRCIGEAEKRFNEDALRILRALRFSATLGFTIEEDTSSAIHSCKKLLENLSAERVFSELKKIVCGKHFDSVFSEYFDVFEEILPELSGMKGFDQHNFHHKYDILKHTEVVVMNTPQDVVLRLSALFHDCGKVDTLSLDESGIGHFYSHASVSSEKCEEALIRLKCDRKTKEQVVKLVSVHDTPIEENESVIAKKLNKYGEDILRKLIILQRADTLGLADEYHSRLEHFERLRELLDGVIEKNQCFSLKDLAVKGNDVKSLGYKGKEVGAVLQYLLDAVVEKRAENNRKALITYLEATYQ